MKRKTLPLLLLAFASFLCVNKIAAQTENASPSLLRHIVMITFKKDAPADSVKVLDDIYLSLSKNPLVKDFEMGLNISPRDTGVVKHIYMTTFASKEDMNSYKKVPPYQNLFKTSLAVASEVTVADYWVKK
jgi:hypothetical protein